MVTASSSNVDTETVEQVDVVVIGAGVTGLYQIYRLRELGLSVRCFEEAGGVGGTWYWNCYPGARFDSESETYGYSWSPELLQEWDWKEHYSGQPENERYLNYVADKFDLRKHIAFGSRVASAKFSTETNRWDVRTDNGHHATARFLIAAVGVFSAHHTPAFEDIDSFEGESFHTARWPREPVELAGKRVAVIGTGASAVQLIPQIVETVQQLTVFQRTPNFCVPSRNSLVDEETQREWKASYPEIHQKIRQTAAGFRHDFDPRQAMSVPEEERLAFYEDIWAKPGFAKWIGNFHDLMFDLEVNEDYAKFVRNKIRERIRDPRLAEKLIPTDHPFGSKRVPLETNYYESYDRNNVELVDVNETPIERITRTGIKTSEQEYEFDVIVYATGFDAVTGPLTRIDIRGEDGQSIAENWSEGLRHYLGVGVKGFPNFFIGINSAFCNYTVCAEMLVEWISDCIQYMDDKGFARIVPTLEAQDAWMQHYHELGSMTVLAAANGKSWFTGGNIPGKPNALLLYANWVPVYRQTFADVAAKGYDGFDLQ